MPLAQLQQPEPKRPVDPNKPPEQEDYVEERDPKTGAIVRRRKTLAPDKATEEISEITTGPTRERMHVTRVTRPTVSYTEEYQKKKTVFHAHMRVRYILALLEILLAFRFFLKLFGADPKIGFARFIYGLSLVFVGAFNNLFGAPSKAAEASGFIEWSTVVAAIFFAVLAWIIAKGFRLNKPVKPEEVERVVEGQGQDKPPPSPR